MPPQLHATCPTEADARRATHSLTAAGIDPTAITVASPSRNPEGSFLTRLVLTIALWSVAGAIIGVGLGTIFWLILGPEGSTGFIIHAVVWGIFGHLIAGLWAGYLLLADRTQQELPHDRPAGPFTLTVQCPNEATLRLATDILTTAGATIVPGYNPAQPTLDHSPE